MFRRACYTVLYKVKQIPIYTEAIAWGINSNNKNKEQASAVLGNMLYREVRSTVFVSLVKETRS